jgi:hypothetical protein
VAQAHAEQAGKPPHHAAVSHSALTIQLMRSRPIAGVRSKVAGRS